MAIKYHIGTQFYKYEDGKDTPSIIRLTRFKDIAGGIFTFTNVDTKERIKMDAKDFAAAGYTKLRPNALITFNLVKVNKDLTDVMVCMHRETDGELPYAICRQSISDIFANTINPNSGNHFVGLSINQDTCPANMPFQNALSCDSVEATFCVSIYIKDTLSDILSLVHKRKYDQTLQLIYSKCEGYQPTPNHDRMTGYCRSLEELLASNKFMYDVHCGMGIIEAPVFIPEDAVELRNTEIDFLESKLKVKIAKTYVTPYTETIDITEIKKDFCLISAITNNKVYVVGYDKEPENA